MIAVLGTGSIGIRHLDVLAALGGVKPIAIPRRETRRTELAQAGRAVAATLDEAVQFGATLCIVATETGRHCEDAVAALERGLDVLVEKPMAVDAAQASALAQRAQALGRKLFVGCTLRFSESLGLFRRRLPEIGQVHTVRIECQSFLPQWRPGRRYQESYAARAEEGGVLRDLIHEIDYAGWIFGWPVAAIGRLRNLGRLGISSEEVAEASWETPEGALVSVLVDYLSIPAQRGMTARGERGTISWDGIQGTVALTIGQSPVLVERSAQTREQMFAEQAKAFIAATRGQPDAPLATAEEGIKALAVCDAARCSSASRREEPVWNPERAQRVEGSPR